MEIIIDSLLTRIFKEGVANVHVIYAYNHNCMHYNLSGQGDIQVPELL